MEADSYGATFGDAIHVRQIDPEIVIPPSGSEGSLNFEASACRKDVRGVGSSRGGFATIRLRGVLRMHTVTTKKQLLEDAGYSYSFERLIYVNRDTRKVFSRQFIEDNSEGEIEVRIEEPGPPPGEWRFYFNSPPSASVRRELYSILK